MDDFNDLILLFLCHFIVGRQAQAPSEQIRAHILPAIDHRFRRQAFRSNERMRPAILPVGALSVSFEAHIPGLPAFRRLW